MLLSFLLVCGFMIFFFKELQTIIFSRQIAAALGIPAKAIYYATLFLIGITINSFFTSIGGMLIFSLIVNPAAAAYQLTYSLPKMFILSAVFGISSCLGGLWAAYIFNVPAGAVIIIVSVLVLVAALAFSPKGEKSLLTFFWKFDPTQLGVGVTFNPLTGLLIGGNPAFYGTINDSLKDPRPTQKLKNQAIYIQDEYQVNERLSYLLGLRYDKYAGRHDDSINDSGLPNIDGSGLSPKVGVNYQFNPETTGYLSVSKAYVMPTLPEYYWWYKAENSGTRINMNKPLKAEEGIAYEIGLKKKLGDRNSYRVTAYYNDIDNYIYNNIFYVPGMLKQVHNVDNVKVWGLELDGEHKFNDRLTVFANYTYQKTKTPKNLFEANVTDDELKNLTELDYHPRHKANIGLRYQTKDKTQIALTARYVGEQKAIYMPSVSDVTKLKLQHLGGYTVANLSITHPFGADKEASLFVDNLFNKQYSEVYGYPMQGTTYGFVYKQKF